jgi:hypothetical protein
MTKKEKEARADESRKRLQALIKPGDTVFTELLSVSSSGMTRHIKPFVIIDNRPVWIGGLVSNVLGYRLDDRGGVVVGGCGSDMGFEIVYNLSWELFKDGFECIGEKCPSNDHSNGDRDYSPHHHKEGGYCLRHKWL